MDREATRKAGARCAALPLRPEMHKERPETGAAGAPTGTRSAVPSGAAASAALPATRRSGGALARRALAVLAARENGGVAAIEFAIVGTVFLMIVAAVADIGLLLFSQSQLDAAVAAGAQFAANGAAVVARDPSVLQGQISDIVNNANGSGWASATVNVNNGNDATGCYCPTGTPGNWTWGSTVTCGSACTGGGVGGQFVTITATRAVAPIFSSFGFAPNGTISSNALVETQ